MIIGDKYKFAVESEITQAYERLSFRALGYFVIYIKGRAYGVRKSDASMLACSFDEVQRRFHRRGNHIAVFAAEPDAKTIANSFLDGVYSTEHENELFFGIAQPQFKELFHSNGLIWAPDGDEAFDDSSYVLQFDVANRVRLIAFKCAGNHLRIPDALSEVWLDSNEYYGILEDWHTAFEAEWEIAPKISKLDDGAEK